MRFGTVKRRSGFGVRRIRRGLERRAGSALDAALERRHRVTTEEKVYLEDQGLPAAERVWHVASQWVPLRRALDRLGVGADDVFVDFGSGLGRALAVAAQFPFDRIVGVELSPELNQRAQRNLDALRGPVRAGRIELVTADALEYEIPDDLTVAYFYCPFYGGVFRRVVESLLASVDRRPRAVRLLYNYPLEHPYLISTGRVRVVDAAPGSWPPRPLSRPLTILTYLVLPGDERLAEQLSARFPPRLRGAECWLGPYDPGFVLQKPARLGGIVMR